MVCRPSRSGSAWSPPIRAADPQTGASPRGFQVGDRLGGGRPRGAPLEERVVLRPAGFDRLARESFDRRPAVALLARCDIRRRTRPGGDELADDDVLLETDQMVLRAVDGGLGEYPGRLPEGRR